MRNEQEEPKLKGSNILAMIYQLIFFLQVLFITGKLAPETPWHNVSWGIILLPMIIPFGLISVVLIIRLFIVFIDFTAKSQPDDRDN